MSLWTKIFSKKDMDKQLRNTLQEHLEVSVRGKTDERDLRTALHIHSSGHSSIHTVTILLFSASNFWQSTKESLEQKKPQNQYPHLVASPHIWTRFYHSIYTLGERRFMLHTDKIWTHTHTCKESQQWAIIKGFYGTGGSIKTHRRTQSILVTQYTGIPHSLWSGSQRVFIMCCGDVGNGETTRDTERQLGWFTEEALWLYCRGKMQWWLREGRQKGKKVFNVKGLQCTSWFLASALLGLPTFIWNNSWVVREKTNVVL